MSSIRQFRKDLRTYILADATITSLISARLYSVRGDQRGPIPSVVMEILDGRDDLTHSGPCGLEELRVQFTIIGSTTDSTDAIRDALYSRLCPASGLNGTIGTSKIGYCIIDNEIDRDAVETKQITKIIDFRLKLNGPQ